MGGRQFLDIVYGGLWKNLHLFYVTVHLLADEICDESGGLPEGGPRAHILRGASLLALENLDIIFVSLVACVRIYRGGRVLRLRTPRLGRTRASCFGQRHLHDRLVRRWILFGGWYGDD